MGIIIKRLLSYVFFIGSLLVAGGRLALDLIGWSTAPEDKDVALGRAADILNWIVSLPAWVPYGAATLLTMWLMYTSWPKQIAPTAHGGGSAKTSAPVLSSLYTDVFYTTKQVKRLISEAGTYRGNYQKDIPTEAAAKVRSVFVSLRSFGITCPDVPTRMTHADAKMVVRFFETAIPFVGSSQLEELKIEARSFVAALEKPKS